jgi:hypothetical protein
MSEEIKEADMAKSKATPETFPETAPETEKRVVVVVAKQPSRWRIGRRFGAEPVEIDAAELDEAQIAALLADPVLVVSGYVAPLQG